MAENSNREYFTLNCEPNKYILSCSFSSAGNKIFKIFSDQYYFALAIYAYLFTRANKLCPIKQNPAQTKKFRDYKTAEKTK